MIRRPRWLHHSRRSECWKLFTGPSRRLWKGGSPLSNIVWSRVLQHFLSCCVWLCWLMCKSWIPSGSRGCGNMTLGTQVQWTAGGSLKDDIAFTFTAIHLKTAPCETGLSSRAAQQHIWACGAWAHQLCTLLPGCRWTSWPVTIMVVPTRGPSCRILAESYPQLQSHWGTMTNI